MGKHKHKDKRKNEEGHKSHKKSKKETDFEHKLEYDSDGEPTGEAEVAVPSAAARDIEKSGTVAQKKDEYGANDYRELVSLKPDHHNRPLYVSPDGHIFLESFSPVYNHAHDFLIAISEPVCRPQLIHEYKLTAYSLYAAVSVGLQTCEIIEYLTRLCKTSIPPGIIEFIKLCTFSYGKVKLVLKQSKYYIESNFPDALQHLLKDQIIQACRAKHDDKAEDVISSKFVGKQALKVNKPLEHGVQDPQAAGTSGKPGEQKEEEGKPEAEVVPSDIQDFYGKVLKEDDNDEVQETQTVSFEVAQEHI